ncbi:MAG: hypothetical protein ACLP0J_22380 [Solirubrobacteraceae bacterium]
MSDVEIELIRDANPFPSELPAPPIGPVLRRVERETDARSARWWRLRIPSLGGIVATASGALVVAIAVVAIVTLGHHAHTPGATRPVHPTAKRGTVTAGRGSRISYAVLGYLLPRTGADFAAGQSLGIFARAVETKAESACMAANRLPGPPVWSEPDGRYGPVELPNMPLIERTLSLGLTQSYPGPTDPAKSLLPSRRAEYKASLARCQAAAPRTLAFLEGAGAMSMLEKWMSYSSDLTKSPSVRFLNRRAHACSRSTGFAAVSVGSEVETIEAKLTRLNLEGDTAQANAIQQRGARVLVRCFGPVVALESRLLAAYRVRFIAAHTQAIRQIEHDANVAVRAAEAKYGVTFDPDVGTHS